MAEITREEFMARLGMAPGTNSSSSPEPITVPPLTQEALDQESKKLGESRIETVTPSKNQDPSWAEKLGARPGVPFDTQSGVSFMSRLRASAQPTPEEEVKALESAYGKGNVRKNSFGWLVVTKPGKDGKPLDTLVDPIGLDLGDAASVLGELPEIAGAILMTARTRGASMAPGIWNAAKTLLAAVGGAAAGGATKDVLVRTAEGEPIQPGEIITRRAERAAVDAAVGTTLGIGAKGIGFLISPYSAPGKIQFDARGAQKYFENKTGIKVSLTPAETTGSSFLQRVEALESQKPGGSIPFEALMKKREEQLTELQRIALGGAVPEEELAGQKALAALGAKAAPLEQGVQKAALETTLAAETELELGVVGRSVNKGALGASIRAKAVQLRDQFTTASKKLYDDVFSDPLTQTKNIPGDELSNEAAALLKKLPTVNKTVTSSILGPTGAPLTSTQPEVLKEFVPDGVLSKLKALSQGKGQDFRLDELMSMRREVDNDIALGESIKGVQTRYLTQIREVLTTRIKDGLKSLSPDLLKKWEAANAHYATGVGKFKKSGISELFKDPEQAGYLGDSAILTRVTEGRNAQDTYRAYKEFFGAGSPEVKGVQQAIRDDVLSQSQLSSTIDAKGFIRRLEALDKDAPEALADAFGAPTAQKLRASALALRAAKGDNLPSNELLEAVQSGNFSASHLQDLLTKQSAKDLAYRNSIIKAVSEGNLKPDSIKPTEFVNKVVFKSEPNDLKGALALLQDRPDVLEDIRRLTFQRVLNDATVVSPSTGRKMIIANDLEKLLSDPIDSKRLQAALGSSTFEDLTQLKNLLKPGNTVQQAARTAGGLSAGMQVAGMIERGPLKYVGQAARNLFISTVYTSPVLRGFLSNTALGTQGKANLVNYIIASTPFLEAVSKTLTEEGARQAIAELKQGVDLSVKADPGQGELPPTREEFMRRLGTKGSISGTPAMKKLGLE
jgi:hypothetical protein